MSVKQCPACTEPVEETWKCCSHCGVKLTAEGAEIGGHETLRAIADEQIEKDHQKRDAQKPPPNPPPAHPDDKDFYLEDLF